MSHPYFDPGDPFAPLPPKAPEPPPKGKVRSGPGALHLVCMVASVVGLAVFCPILFKLKAMDEETQITGPLVLQALGFVLSLVVFAGTLGVRVAHWLAAALVNLIFNMDGNGWTWEEERRMKRERQERAQGRRTPDA